MEWPIAMDGYIYNQQELGKKNVLANDGLETQMMPYLRVVLCINNLVPMKLVYTSAFNSVAQKMTTNNTRIITPQFET